MLERVCLCVCVHLYEQVHFFILFLLYYLKNKLVHSLKGSYLVHYCLYTLYSLLVTKKKMFWMANKCILMHRSSNDLTNGLWKCWIELICRAIDKYHLDLVVVCVCGLLLSYYLFFCLWWHWWRWWGLIASSIMVALINGHGKLTWIRFLFVLILLFYSNK